MNNKPCEVCNGKGLVQVRDIEKQTQTVKACPACQPTKKPPLGLMPEKIWKEKRLQSIKAAIDRFLAAFQPVPPEWIDEYNRLNKEVHNQ